MAHYMRYLVTDPQEITWETLEGSLKAIDPAYRIEAHANVGTLHYGDGTYGRIETGRPGDEFFAEETQDLVSALEVVPYDDRKTVRRVMHETRVLLALKVIWEDRDNESTLQRIRPLWDWLLANRTGLLQIDDEGYYGPGGLILEVKP